ncbi:MAG TPA: helix-turn-helix domain-containing protein [Jatrophihabitantaceae bacterium]
MGDVVMLDGVEARWFAARRGVLEREERANGRTIPKRMGKTFADLASAAQAAEGRALAAAAVAGSDPGTAKVPELGGDGSAAPQSRELTVDEAIDVIGAIGNRGVRKACKSGRLRGRKHGGAWLIEETSVVEFAKSRRRRSTAATTTPEA